MRYADWSTLKAASKVAFKKIAASGNEPEYIVLEQKRYDTNTGVEVAVLKKRISLLELESKKNRLTQEKATIQTELTEVGKMITQIKKV